MVSTEISVDVVVENPVLFARMHYRTVAAYAGKVVFAGASAIWNAEGARGVYHTDQRAVRGASLALRGCDQPCVESNPSRIRPYSSAEVSKSMLAC
jgi:hypothetical protein